MTLLPTPDMTQFKFRPLEEADAIRLLVLYPSHETTAPLSGSLINTTLSECDADFLNGYLALSYVWGDPAPTKSICLDDINIGITASVAEALVQLRNAYPGGTQRIWVDALCINQSDIAEKNRQVPLMGNIYSIASATVIYLGSLSAEIETIFRAVREKKPKSVTIDTKGKSHIAYPRDLQQMKSFDITVGAEPSAIAIDELLRRPWFTRIWVFQELMLSRDAWVQCGALRVRWRELCALLVPILDRTKKPDSTSLQQMHSIYWDGKNQSLSSILRLRQRCLASDPRDMIFGYMGMHDDKEEVAKFITVDYETPLRQLLISTARYIHCRDGLQVLLRCVKRPPTNTWLNLPSWVPDWGMHRWPQVASMSGETPNDQTATTQTDDMLVVGEDGNGGVTWRLKSPPKSIQHVSPILPRPQDMPQQIVDFLERAGQIVSCFDNNCEKRSFLREENVSFWRNLEVGSCDPQNPSHVKLFPDRVWDPAVGAEENYHRDRFFGQVATKAYQILSFFMEYMGSRISSASNFYNAFKWGLDKGQKMRLALSTAGFVLSVPAYVEVGDEYVGFERSPWSPSYLPHDDLFFGCLMRPLVRHTGKTRTNAYKWLDFCNLPRAEENIPDKARLAHIMINSSGDNDFGDSGEFDIQAMRRYKDAFFSFKGTCPHAELC